MTPEPIVICDVPISFEEGLRLLEEVRRRLQRKANWKEEGF